MSVDKTVRKARDPAQQQAESDRYWQSLSIGDRLTAVWEASAAAYAFAAAFNEHRPMMPSDLKDRLRAFNDHSVKYIVVGGYALGVHAEPLAQTRTPRRPTARKLP